MVQLISGSGAPYDLVADGDERTYSDLTTREGLTEIATYAAGIGPSKSLVIPRDADGTLGEPTSLVDDAHAEGLVVHPYTFRNENTFLLTDLRAGQDPAAYGRAIEEHLAFLDAGVDGLFTDNPDTGIEARRIHLTSADSAA
jgi:glycerophosphoryl diester phosphodiesterase